MKIEFAAIAISAAILLGLAFCAPRTEAAEVVQKTVTEAPAECKGSPEWECRRCTPDGKLTEGDGGCLCKFCVSPDSGKTVESANDLRGIYCFDRRTQLDEWMRQHRAQFAGIW